MTDFPVREVREGRASLLVPDVPVLGGPGRRSTLPFYNPAMTVNRDVTLSVLSAILPPNATFLDGLAGTGVLGVRAALETDRSPRITWNDKNPNAHDLILQNAARNHLEGEVLTDDLRAVLARRRFDYVDIDPFGPATPFMDAAIQQARNGGVLGINATDVSPLAGTHPRACWRRYGARSIRNACGRETALRIFVGFLVRLAAMHERGIRPLTAFSAEHFVKAIVAVDLHTSAADAGLAQLGYVRFEGANHEISATPPNGPHAGPLWLGPLADPTILAAITPGAGAGYSGTHLLGLLKEENALPPFFYENHSLAQSLGVDDPVPVGAFLNALRSIGFRATRTHFAANAMRTDAPWADVSRLYRDLGRGKAARALVS